MARIVYVIMGNDFPDAVFAQASDADRYIERQKAQEKKDHPERHTSRIYWRSMAFELQESLPAEKNVRVPVSTGEDHSI